MSLEFRPVCDGKKNAKWIATLHGKSGVYLIREKGFGLVPGAVVYVGESHTNRLGKTLLRHFQHWTGKTAGVRLDAQEVTVAIVRCPADKALALQNAIIEEYRPRLNIVANPDAQPAK